MRVRAAEAADFEAVTALLEELGRAQVTDATRDHCRALWERQVAEPDSAHLVAEREGAVIGFCSLHFRGRLNYPTPDAWIPDLIVTAPARRRGAGRALLAKAERLAGERGCWSLVLESGHERTEAHRLYIASGMADTGRTFGKLL